MNTRIEKLLNLMKENDLKQMLVTDPSSIFYLIGKWIHAGERLIALLIKEDGNHRIFINKLFPVNEDLGIEKVWFSDTDDSIALLTKYIDKNEDLGIDKTWPSGFLINLLELNAAKSYKNSSNLVDFIRMQKDEEEKEAMRVASKLNDEAMFRVKEYIADNPDMSEKEIEKYLSLVYEELGADGYSFTPIIAFGKNGADPHHETDNSTLEKGNSIIIDIGCVKDSYCSDMTRTYFFGEVSNKHREVYNIVRDANLKAIEQVKIGNTFSMVDKAARNYIEEKGYGKYFTHRTGHSIGIDTHEHGDVSSINDELLKEGMIFSIEPGIYLPNEMGVRIEDLVLVTKDGCEMLNSVSKELEIV